MAFLNTKNFSTLYLIFIQYESCRAKDRFLQLDWQHEPLVGLGVVLKFTILYLIKSYLLESILIKLIIP